MKNQTNNRSSRAFDLEALEKFISEGKRQFAFMKPINSTSQDCTGIFAFKYDFEVEEWEMGMKKHFIVSKYNYSDHKPFLHKEASGESDEKYELPHQMYNYDKALLNLCSMADLRKLFESS